MMMIMMLMMVMMMMMVTGQDEHDTGDGDDDFLLCFFSQSYTNIDIEQFLSYIQTQTNDIGTCLRITRTRSYAD